MNCVPARLPSTASKYSSNLAQSRPPSESPNSLNHSLQVYLQTCSIVACKFAQSWPASAYIQTRSITASKSISRLAWAWPSSVHYHAFQVHITKPARSRLPSASPNIAVHRLQVHLQIWLITASKCFSKVTRSRPGSIYLSSLDFHFQAHLELLSSTACSQSRYSVYRWVAI